MRHTASVALLTLLAAAPVAAQAATSDSARLVVTQDGQPIGTEDFAYRVGAAGVDPTTVTFVATTNGAPRQLRAGITIGARRITVRIATADGETGREYPGGPNAVVADERILALYALLARHDPGPVTVYGPPPGGRRPGTLEDAGQVRLPGTNAPGRKLTLRSGEDVVDVWFDVAGRLMRVEIPSRRLVAERVVIEP